MLYGECPDLLPNVCLPPGYARDNVTAFVGAGAAAVAGRARTD